VLVSQGVPAAEALELAVLTHALKFAYSFTAGAAFALAEGVSLLRGRREFAPKRASRLEVLAARTWNVVNEGKPFTPAFTLFVLAVIAGWLITLGINFAIGCLAFFVDSALRVMDIYLALFMVASGYLIPVDLFPPAARAIVERLPFRHQIALGVELMTGRYDHDLGGAARAVATSWAWVFGIFVVVFLVWRRGLRRYGAFGG